MSVGLTPPPILANAAFDLPLQDSVSSVQVDPEHVLSHQPENVGMWGIYCQEAALDQWKMWHNVQLTWGPKKPPWDIHFIVTWKSINSPRHISRELMSPNGEQDPGVRESEVHIICKAWSCSNKCKITNTKRGTKINICLKWEITSYQHSGDPGTFPMRSL